MDSAPCLPFLSSISLEMDTCGLQACEAWVSLHKFFNSVLYTDCKKNSWHDRIVSVPRVLISPSSRKLVDVSALGKEVKHLFECFLHKLGLVD